MNTHTDQAVSSQAPFASPWLSSAEACDYLRFTGPNRLRSLYRFLKVNGVATGRRGSHVLLIARADLDEAIRGRRRAPRTSKRVAA